MPSEWMSTLWSFVRKGSAPLAVAVALVSAALLWVPSVAALGPADWRTPAALVFLSSLVLVLAHAFEVARRSWRGLVTRRRKVKLLQHLAPEAKAIIIALFQNEVLRLDYRDAPVSLLDAAGVLYRPSVSHGGFRFDFTLQPWARSFFQKHPGLLADAASDLTVRVYDRNGPWWQ